MTSRAKVSHDRNYGVLGTLERAVMEVMWRKGEATVRDVLGAVGRKNGLAYTTIMTVMARLTEKGILQRTASAGGSFVYRPRVSRDAFYAAASRRLFSDLLREAGSVAIAPFVDAIEEVDPDQLAALRARLRRRGERTG